jgi:hypothetical protein
MRRSLLAVVVSAMLVGSTAQAATFTFNIDPFAGSTALTTPGRQIVPPAGTEPFITFDPSTDEFVFDSAIFGISSPLTFASGPAGSLPASGAEVIVLQEFGPPMAAGTAANLIAAQVTSPGPGVFVYFNTGLGVPRLVYSTNLDDNTADLAVLARMTNLGVGSMAQFNAGNFDAVDSAVPEPITLLLFSIGAVTAVRRRYRSA